MKDHWDLGVRCLVFHGDGGGQCIKCTCGVMVRPTEWQAHLDAAEKEDARLKRTEQRHEAERAVTDAAKAMADHLRQPPATNCYTEWLVARDGLLTAVATLRKLEGEA